MKTPTAGERASRHRSRRAVALVAALAVLAAGTFVWWRHWGPGHGRVAIVGDSITFLTAPAYESWSGLGFRYEPAIVATPGARADQEVAEAAALAAQKPEQAVVNLGTNDVLQGWATDQTVTALEQIGTGFADAKCIALVTVNENIDKLDVTEQTVALNAEIRALAARHGWRTIAWDEIVRDYLASGQPDGPVTTDSIHPTDVGQRLLIAATYQALAQC